MRQLFFLFPFIYITTLFSMEMEIEPKQKLEIITNPLIQAIEEEDIDAIQKILTNSPELINQQDKAKTTPIMLAVNHNKTDALRELIKYRPRLNMIDNKGKTALFYAIENKNLTIVNLLIENLLKTGNFISALKGTKESILTFALRQGNSDIANAILNAIVQRKQNFDLPDKEGKTPLMYAIENEDYRMIQILLRLGAFLGQRDKKGLTPLIYAVNTGDKEIVYIILKDRHSGTWTKLQDKQGKNALMHAIELGNQPIINEIINYYKTALVLYQYELIKAQDSQGKTALIYAIEKDNIIATAELLEINAKITDVIHYPKKIVLINDSNNKSPLMYAIEKDNPELVKLIIQYNPNIATKDNRGFTALDYAKGMILANYPNAREIYELMRDYVISQRKPEIPERPAKRRRP